MSDLIGRFRAALVRPKRFDDERGSVYEMLRLPDLAARHDGQLFVTTARSGQSKGHHYHSRKTEWFCVVAGSGEMVLEDVETGERDQIAVSADDPLVLKIEPGLAHALRNSGTTLLISIVYADETYDPLDEDTYPRRLF